MERLKVPKPGHSVKLQRVFENGHMVHERIQKELADAGIMIRDEVPLHAPDHNMHGHTDGIGLAYFAGIGGVTCIIEIKSCNEKSFAWIAGGGPRKYKGNGADKAHKYQVQMYMYMSGLMYAYIIYENKNTQERKSFIEVRDNDLIHNVLLPKVDLVNAHVQMQTLPPRDEEHKDRSCFHCKYCDYQATCEAEEESFKPVDLVALGNRMLLEQQRINDSR
jgi:CRISPR/Cas system-associated exonuclease Cas4 (RecB family)